MKASRRVTRFSDLLALSDAQIDALIERRAVAIRLGKGTPEGDAEAFEAGAKDVFLSDDQIRRLLRILLDLARVHAERFFATDSQYKLRLNEANPWGETESSTICFTGLAGVGKTDLFIALVRLLASDERVDVPGYLNLPLVAVWRVTIKDGVGLNTLLRPQLSLGRPRTPGRDGEGEVEERNSDSNTNRNIPLLLRMCRRRTWRDAVCLLVADEFQNVSKGNAFIKATSLLLRLRGIGPKLLFCLNYSLIHRLKRSAQEDQQRLLGNPIVMFPLRQGSPAWIAFLLELAKLAPEVFVFDVVRLEATIHHYTFGIKRNVVVLFKWAYVAARRKGRKAKVDADCLREAYCSLEYSAIRQEVLDLQTQVITGKKERDDLWCPFDSGDEKRPMFAERTGEKASTKSGNVSEATAAIEEFERRTNDAYIAASMTRQQSTASAELSAAPPVAKRKADVFRLPRKKSTKEDLVNGAAFLESLD